MVKRDQTLRERALNKETKTPKVVVYLPIKVHRYTTVKGALSVKLLNTPVWEKTSGTSTTEIGPKVTLQAVPIA